MIDKIFMTIFLEGGELPNPLPPQFQENLDGCQRMHPGADLKIYSLKEARAFIAKNFDADVLEAFETLAPFAYKSDLTRYALLYMYGGLYTDVSLRWLRPLPVNREMQLLVFKDMGTPISWSVNQALIYAKPRRPEFLDAIRKIVANVKTQYYGVSAICPTGPNVFGAALASQNRIHDYTFGWHRYLTPGEGLGTPAFLVGGDLIALKFKTRHGDISSLGFVGANNYIDAWYARRIYGETGLQWKFFDRHIACEGATRGDEGIAFSPQQSGVQTYGPYCQLEPGAYEISLSFAPPGFTGRLGIDVTADVGERILSAYRVFDSQELDGATLRFPLTLDGPENAVEIRTKNHAGLFGSLLAIKIERAPA